jgi:hypothetical protein
LRLCPVPGHGAVNLFIPHPPEGSPIDGGDAT